MKVPVCGVGHAEWARTATGDSMTRASNLTSELFSHSTFHNGGLSRAASYSRRGKGQGIVKFLCVPLVDFVGFFRYNAWSTRS